MTRLPSPWPGLLLVALLPTLLLAGCSTEHIQEPWVGDQQRSLVEGELERNEEAAEELRDRLARGQADR